MTDKRWTVGKLRQELQGLPEDMELLVNVSVADDYDPVRGRGGFIPVTVNGGGFDVSVPNEVVGEPDVILPIFNIETEVEGGYFLWRNEPGPTT